MASSNSDSDGEKKPRVLVAAGGTGGHLFPAEALAAALERRNVAVELVTDSRAARHASAFREETVHVIPSATVRGKNPLSLIRTGAVLGYGLLKAYFVLPRLKPAVVVGFGGYPTIPPLLVATALNIPSIIHEQNAVMGRANRMLATRVRAIATGVLGLLNREPALAAKATYTGNPVRPAVIAAADTPYPPLEPNGSLQLLVFGGSQGAKVMSDIVPPAIKELDPPLRERLKVVQQAREEDLVRVREAYAELKVDAKVESFFTDLPARMAGSHLVVARSGASTVAELSAIGRPAILVPLPNALDQDQFVNAGVLMEAGGAVRLDQSEFTPERLAVEIAALIGDPGRLTIMANAAKAQGLTNAAERLADLVLRVAGVIPPIR